MSAHPADTARPGDAFRDENGVIWLLTDDVDGVPWVTSGRIGCDRWHTTDEAREHTFTPLAPEVELTEQLDVPLTPDPSDPAQLRLVMALLDELRASGEMDGYQVELAVVARELGIRADRLDADAADHIKAVEFAEDLSFYGALNPNGQSQLVTALVEFRRAGRDAERGA